MTFLVAVDGSAESDAALAYAIDVAEAMAVDLRIAHVVDPAAYDLGGDEPISSLADAERHLIVESLEDAEDRGMDVVDDARAVARERGHDVPAELLYGNPVAELTALAAETDVDAIFVGHRGRSDRTDMMLGSVAKELVGRASVPVTVVR